MENQIILRSQCDTGKQVEYMVWHLTVDPLLQGIVAKFCWNFFDPPRVISELDEYLEDYNVQCVFTFHSFKDLNVHRIFELMDLKL